MKYARLDILHAVQGFYSLEAMAELGHRRIDPFSRAQAKWGEDLQELRERYTAQLSKALFDYLAMACAGEARHARNCCRFYCPSFPPGERSDAYREAVWFDPRRLLERCRELFGRRWMSGYGGESWKKIAEGALLYGQVPDAAFVDHAVDLTHNNGACFDKTETGIFGFLLSGSAEYREFLDRKREVKSLAALLTEIVFFPDRICTLLRRGVRLGLLPLSEGDFEPLGPGEPTFDRVLRYQPIKWGNATPDPLEESPPEDEKSDSDPDSNSDSDDAEQPPASYGEVAFDYLEQGGDRGVVLAKSGEEEAA